MQKSRYFNDSESLGKHFQQREANAFLAALKV
jgi:hypothetical protein